MGKVEEKSLKLKEKKVTQPKKKKEKKGTSEKVKGGFFKNLKNELSKVKWPTAKEILKYSLATLLFCVILAGFFQLLDLLVSFVKGLFN